MKKTIKKISLFAALISLVSCGGSGKAPKEASEDSVNVTSNNENTKDAVLYNIPSPIETFTILKISGSTFDKSVLNPANKISKYVSNFSKSVNLGTYSADLAFCSMYNQNQEVNIYLKNVNELTSTLDIDGSYGQSITKRLQANGENSDSLKKIIAEASVNADMYLKENQRNNTAALIIAGGWVEAMHIITNIADKTKKTEIISLVADQKIVLKHLNKILEKFDTDEEIKGLLNDLKAIAAIYDTLKTSQGTASANEDKSMASIGNNKSLDLPEAELKSILDKIETLRNKLTI